MLRINNNIKFKESGLEELKTTQEKNFISSLFNRIFAFLNNPLTINSLSEKNLSPIKGLNLSFKVLEAADPSFNGLLHKWVQIKRKAIRDTEKQILADLIHLADKGSFNTPAFKERLKQLPLDMQDVFCSSKNLEKKIVNGKVEILPIARGLNSEIRPSLEFSSHPSFHDLVLEWTILKNSPLNKEERQLLTELVFMADKNLINDEFYKKLVDLPKKLQVIFCKTKNLPLDTSIQSR